MPGLRIAAFVLLLSPGLFSHAVAQSDAIEWRAVERSALFEMVRLDGSVEAVRESTVSAQTAGTVMELPFDVDDPVEQGALIARLEDTEQRSRLRQAEGNLEEAQSGLLDARQQFERIESLYERNVASRSDLDEARNRLDGARARFTRAEASVAEAREELDYTRIEAPYTGVVTERHVEIGESVRPGQPLLSGFSLDELRVVVAVPQRFIDQARDPSRLTVSRDDGRRLTVERITVFPFADPQSHSFRVRLVLEQAADGIAPGMLVRVDLAATEREALWIPADSLLQRGELRAVFARDAQGQPRLRQVRVGVRKNDQLEILAGLDDDDAVAARPYAVFERTGTPGPLDDGAPD